MKKMIALFLAALVAVGLMACNKVTLHCDNCGKEVKADNNMTEEWLIFCSDCEKELDVDLDQ